MPSKSSAKTFAKVAVVFNGAGAAGIACAEHYVRLGVKRENIILCDTKGVVYHRPQRRNEQVQRALRAGNRTAHAWPKPLVGADVFAGLSVKGAITARHGALHGARSRRLRHGESRSRNYLRRSQSALATMSSSPPAAPTIPTRSTTFSASPSSSAARSTCAPPPSTKR